MPQPAAVKSTDKPVTAAKPAQNKSTDKPSLAAAQSQPASVKTHFADASGMPKKSVDKPTLGSANPMTKRVQIAKDRPACSVTGQAFGQTQGLPRRPMNAPTPALVAPRPERLRLVGQRRQLLAVMHQRLMFGMLVYAGLIALIALRILYLAAFGDHAGPQGRANSAHPGSR